MIIQNIKHQTSNIKHQTNRQKLSLYNKVIRKEWIKNTITIKIADNQIKYKKERMIKDICIIRNKDGIIYKRN